MKTVISVSGRFHAFDMARELNRHGALYRLITSYPRYGAARFGVPKELVRSLVLHEVLNRVWFRHAPAGLRSRIDLVPQFGNAFDRAVTRRIPKDANVFIGWASKSLRSLRRAKELGQLAVLDRGSSHCLAARRLLSEESRATGHQLYSPPEKVNETELEEYDAADYILMPSSFVRRTFMEHGVSERKLIQIPYGVELDSFRPLPRRDSVFRVVFAGGMRLRKGVHYLLQAFAELNLKNAELWLIGSCLPEIRPYFDKYADHFIYHGHVPQRELADYYSQCSLFAICSVEEGLALVQPQAMACGLPLLCTTNTGGEDLIEDGESGFVIPIRSVQAIKEKILWCYENQETCREMGGKARERVSAGLTWRDYGDRLVSELEKRIH